MKHTHSTSAPTEVPYSSPDQYQQGLQSTQCTVIVAFEHTVEISFIILFFLFFLLSTCTVFLIYDFVIFKPCRRTFN